MLGSSYGWKHLELQCLYDSIVGYKLLLRTHSNTYDSIARKIPMIVVTLKKLNEKNIMCFINIIHHLSHLVLMLLK